MEENIKPVRSKKEKIKLTVLVASILMIISSLSYAFFVAATSTPAITDVDLTTETSEALIFTPGTPIELRANLTNFAENAGSLSESTTSTATLRAASSVGSATEYYFVYFNIENNNFEYTVDANTPEMLLTITGPDGEIKTIDGLNYKTVTDAKTGNNISGFDVTTHEGIIEVKRYQEITTTSEKIDDWTATITFINLDSDQTANEGKTFDSELVLRDDEMKSSKDLILTYNGRAEYIESKSNPDFTESSTTNEGMFAAPDDYGTSYYYRGAVDNNWFKFADMYWRIIRINGDGSIRLIYSGTTQPTEGEAVAMLGTKTQIVYSEFNNLVENIESAGYMYTIGQRDGLDTDSTAKQAIDTWYENNILGTEYEAMLSDTLFCGDRTSYTDRPGTTPATGIEFQYFGSHIRVYDGYPSYECPNRIDAYTVSDEVYGNGALDYPVGMITADEAALAGLRDINFNHYLYTNQNYWTFSPNSYTGSVTIGMHVSSMGEIAFTLINYHEDNMGLRPVVSLSSKVMISGTGMWNDPFVVSQ